MIRLLALLALLASGQAWAATKYVSTDGATGGGAWAACTTTAAPCALATAVANAAAGDTVILMDGTYSTGINTVGAGSDGSPVTWQAQNNRMAVINGYASGQTDKVIQVDVAYHVFDGLVVVTQTGPGAANTYGLYVAATGTNTQFINGEIYYGGDEATTGETMQMICAQLRAVTLFEDNYVHDCTIGVNLFVSANPGHASTIRGNTIANMTVGDHEDSDCLSAVAGASYDWTGLVIEENECSGYTDDGFDFLIQDNVTLRFNDIHDPITDSDGNSSGVKVGYFGSNNNRVYGNYIHDLNADANNRHYGMVVQGASDALIYGNIIDGPYVGVEVSENADGQSDNNHLFNNTITNSITYGFKVSDVATNTVFTNNSVEGGAASFDMFVDTGTSATGYKNNLVNNTEGGAGTYTGTGDVSYSPGFSDGADPVSKEGHKLSSDSALRRIGKDLNLGNIQDCANRAFAHPPSIGACESTSGDIAATRTVAATRTARQ